MPRACPVDRYVPRYILPQLRLGMPRACPVDRYVPRYNDGPQLTSRLRNEKREGPRLKERGISAISLSAAMVWTLRHQFGLGWVSLAFS